MKPTLLTCLLSFICFQLWSANPPKKLLELNPYWQGVDFKSTLPADWNNYSEKQLIEFHLLEVIDSLNCSDLSQYSAEQIAKRKALLSDLSDYAKKGEFPINSYHWERTPYFIDNAGTACAVGHLIIQSGHSELAQRVSNEMNYAYIEDMPFQEIEIWASEHGFTVDELKWIQPGYGPQCPKDTAIAPICPSGIGCINPDFYKTNLDSSSLSIDASERNIGNGWFLDTNMWIYFYQGFFPYGNYRFCLSDSLNQRDTIYYDIMGPTPFVLEDSIVQASNNCFNTIHLSAQNGQPPYRFRLFELPSYNQIMGKGQLFDSLCPGDYLAELSDSNYCYYSKQITISGISSISEDASNVDHWFVQNPVVNGNLQLYTEQTGIKQFKIFSLSGQLLKEMEFSKNEVMLDLKLKNGIYILQISHEGKRSNKKVVVSN